MAGDAILLPLGMFVDQFAPHLFASEKLQRTQRVLPNIGKKREQSVHMRILLYGGHVSLPRSGAFSSPCLLLLAKSDRFGDGIFLGTQSFFAFRGVYVRQENR